MLKSYLVGMIGAIGILASTATPALAAEPPFSDGFEAATIDPFWTVQANAGCSASLTTSRAYTGVQSVQLTTTNTGQTKGVLLRHDFAAPVYGRASVWVYDTGADVASSNYFTLLVGNNQVGRNATIGTFDYDLGPTNGGSYVYSGWGADAHGHSGIDRTQGWHHWEIESRPNLLELRVDGTVVYSDEVGEPFDMIYFDIHAPSWRPPFSVQYDDFEFEELGCVPIEGDLDGDGDVDLIDLSTLLANFGRSCP